MVFTNANFLRLPLYPPYATRKFNAPFPVRYGAAIRLILLKIKLYNLSVPVFTVNLTPDFGMV